MDVHRRRVAHGVVVFHSAGGHRFVLQAMSWGRVLTESHLPGPLPRPLRLGLRSRAGVSARYEPTNTYGFGLSPLVWRWNFEPRGRVAPYAELAGGGLWTTEPVPDRTTAPTSPRMPAAASATSSGRTRRSS